MTPSDFGDTRLTSDETSLRQAISDKLRYVVGKSAADASPRDWLQAAELAVRDRLVERWHDSSQAHDEGASKRVYYLSMEFLIGRAFTNAALSLGIYDALQAALSELGVDLAEITELEPDAALGNGGLGRLAACFLDSMATVGIAGMGYGIRYDYGMFRQQIIGGEQIESPDYWLNGGNPWEFPRPDVLYRIQFGGHTEVERSDEDDGTGNAVRTVHRWVGTDDVLAMAYDTVIPGHAVHTTNTLRLWSARATSEINLSEFNKGDYFGAVEEKNHSENVSRVLYPDDSTLSGRELRLRQEFFFVSASVQDLLRRHHATHASFDNLAAHVAIHLNDTHPVLAVPEVLRVLMDDYGLEWATAWILAQQIFSYTNHTLMSEALETWPVSMIERVLPRHLDIIYRINARFLDRVVTRFGPDVELMRRVSVIDESGERRVRMAYLAVVASHKINGVSKLHSELMTQSIFVDLARIFPERFTNMTNGITPRRWLSLANPPLATLIDHHIGGDWRRNLDHLAKLRPLADDPGFLDAFIAAKQDNKARLAEWVDDHLGIALDPAALLDVQVKRIHEYKRQLLNLLHVITRYNRILANPHADWVPRTVLFGGKAASAYHMAKLIIRLINDVAQTINNDPRIGDRLKVVFVPNYGVSLAQLIIPAADLSQQISLAGTEASGTGNMKLALNGALTIGTLDGANVEISEQVGADNIFIFGNTTPQVQALQARGDDPRQYYAGDLALRQVLDQIRDGAFSQEEPERYRTIVATLLDRGDQYLLLADYASYVAAQDAVDVQFRDQRGWYRKAVLNVAAMGMFSSDRTVTAYASEIWGSRPLNQ